MTKEEIEILQALKILGFNYIARDGNGGGRGLYTYYYKPDYSNYGDYYFTFEDYSVLQLDPILFSFINPKECKRIEEVARK